MISNEERREVAMSLRTAKQSELCRLSDGELLDNLAVTLGVDSTSEHYEDALFDHLIDLIDRPTCRKLIPDEMEGLVFCSNCRAEIGEYGVPNYCHNCGAEVVHDA